MNEEPVHDLTDWVVILGPGPLAVVRTQLQAWRAGEGRNVPDDDIRVDTIRADGGDEMRVRRRVVSDM
ncbi:hypothetical protein [Nocardioides bizhenqiangii]|uniref:Uncharacterized protein n=1 Tax=Nocardioides bizhenqiangii TaxID=3095076 RepID=A0ABZ0ZNW3_9ACTN|nr:hypothetical protein [Nocardioides sp. HM61]WQQ25656.1 hypothetical protein SHK19_17020 [Nocardioides sp. HM61]